ncbi:hypothetical protein KVT40_005702 [Elsinoe batatas]|uniref:NAD-dependent epimerase/dehydratase domain-containing protein n=1 Tax=Elsinoe batatas TaxID=2601811 RepID=A0A8K0L0A5_9PEZI|nr:hypothetical protein KVT40_005702 [Elsinoe batatas]
MAILITGSTGRLGSALIDLLSTTTHPLLAATRRSRPPPSLATHPTVHLDWHDESTWITPFSPPHPPITSVFLLAVPGTTPQVRNFATLCASQGVKRIVFMAGASAVKGQGMWAHLDQLREEYGITYSLVSPCWLNENLLAERYVAEIKQGFIKSGLGTGEAPWSAARDVAAVSLWALTVEGEGPENTIVAGWERLSGVEIAETFTRVLGRRVQHYHLSLQENVEYLKGLGYPPGSAQLVAQIEAYSAAGKLEQVPYEDIEEKIGRPMVKFEDWVEEHKVTWL